MKMVAITKDFSYRIAMSKNAGRIKDEDVEAFLEWLRKGVRRGWVSDVVCSTHDGTPLTEEETEMFDEGDDPCIRVVRVWDV